MTTQVQPEWFHNKGSYDAFIYAVTLVEKIKEAQSKGAKIFDEDGLMTGEWLVDYDPDTPSIDYKTESADGVYSAVIIATNAAYLAANVMQKNNEK